MTQEENSSPEPNFRDAFSAAARRSGLGRVTPGEAPTGSALLAAMGGVRGIVETILPGLGFLVVYAITAQLVPSVLIPLAVAVAFVLIRIVMRQPWTPAVAGVIGIGISAGLALITGRPEDNFVPGFIINAVFLVGLLISLAVRWPLVGVISSLITGEGPSWRADRAKVRVAVIATILWCGLFATRLIVELPMYFAGATAALATTKLILGVPFYAAMLWITWLLVRTAWSTKSGESGSGESDEADLPSR